MVLRAMLALVILLPTVCSADGGGTLTLHLPADMKVAAASANLTGEKQPVSGTVAAGKVTFENLSPGMVYDIRLDLADKTVLQGVNLNWYDDQPAAADAGPLSDDDRAAIADILKIPSFYNHTDTLLMRGTHQRAVGLIQLIRDKDFYNGSGEIIWRIEINYFEEEFGGWERVAQQNKIVCRERFHSRQEYEAAVLRYKWEPALGGIAIPASGGALDLSYSPTTQPSTNP